jgi:hypothetical protein
MSLVVARKIKKQRKLFLINFSQPGDLVTENFFQCIRPNNVNRNPFEKILITEAIDIAMNRSINIFVVTSYPMFEDAVLSLVKQRCSICPQPLFTVEEEFKWTVTKKNDKTRDMLKYLSCKDLFCFSKTFNINLQELHHNVQIYEWASNFVRETGEVIQDKKNFKLVSWVRNHKRWGQDRIWKIYEKAVRNFFQRSNQIMNVEAFDDDELQDYKVPNGPNAQENQDFVNNADYTERTNELVSDSLTLNQNLNFLFNYHSSNEDTGEQVEPILVDNVNFLLNNEATANLVLNEEIPDDIFSDLFINLDDVFL